MREGQWNLDQKNVWYTAIGLVTSLNTELSRIEESHCDTDNQHPGTSARHDASLSSYGNPISSDAMLAYTCPNAAWSDAWKLLKAPSEDTPHQRRINSLANSVRRNKKIAVVSSRTGPRLYVRSGKINDASPVRSRKCDSGIRSVSPLSNQAS
mmetsp:Transcript_15576/g.37161  ORF Transcript_15576/g.37161 Transcript_15576/m.37161 type:complete len:153 (+) Transcript_15576:172-630(+)